MSGDDVFSFENKYQVYGKNAGRKTVEIAHPEGRGNWRVDVRARAVVFVATGARCYRPVQKTRGES